MTKRRRRRIDVDLDELDQIIEHGMCAPMSEAEGQKVKTALHAMAECLMGKPSTEKTRAGGCRTTNGGAPKAGQRREGAHWAGASRSRCFYRRKPGFDSARHAPRW